MIEYVLEYKFTSDEIKALEDLEEKLPTSSGQEVIWGIIKEAKDAIIQAESGL